MPGQQIDHLVKMANQIALNFGAERDPTGAAARTAQHLKKFWTRDMRRQLAAHGASGGDDLSHSVRQMLDQDPNFEEATI